MRIATLNEKRALEHLEGDQRNTNEIVRNAH